MSAAPVPDLPVFALGPTVDAVALAAEFRRHGRVRIVGFMADPEPLRTHLLTREDWRQVINSGATVYELDRPTRAGLSGEKAAQLDRAVYDGAREGFQFRFESIRIPDAENERRALADPLAAFASWMSAGATRDLLRTICGTQAIDFADAQATAFAPGDFLTGHDDAVEGKGRRAAYVFGLTRIWRPEWGGVLMFHESENGVSGRVPGFNTLDLFAVPQMHSVSLVSPAAPERRLSVTGWLRSAS